MSINICAFDHKTWDRYSLADYGDFAECVTECNRQEWNDHTTGAWYYAPDELLAVGDDVYRVIYSGTWGNCNSPGASCYTFADLYSVTDPDDVREHRAHLAELEALPEWLPSEVEDYSEEDYSEEDENADKAELREEIDW